jgi:ornithine decarboxylase
MIEFAVKPPTIPIPFHKLLKVVAIVDGHDRQTKELLAHIAAEHFEIEVSDRLDRDVSEDADVGAFIALIDGERRDKARCLVRAIRSIGYSMPLWAPTGPLATTTDTFKPENCWNSSVHETTRFPSS